MGGGEQAYNDSSQEHGQGLINWSLRIPVNDKFIEQYCSAQQH